MKKKGRKKLRLSRETLRDLAASDAQKVVGGVITQSWLMPCSKDSDDTCDTGDSCDSAC